MVDAMTTFRQHCGEARFALLSGSFQPVVLPLALSALNVVRHDYIRAFDPKPHFRFDVREYASVRDERDAVVSAVSDAIRRQADPGARDSSQYGAIVVATTLAEVDAFAVDFEKRSVPCVALHRDNFEQPDTSAAVAQFLDFGTVNDKPGVLVCSPLGGTGLDARTVSIVFVCGMWSLLDVFQGLSRAGRHGKVTDATYTFVRGGLRPAYRATARESDYSAELLEATVAGTRVGPVALSNASQLLTPQGVISWCNTIAGSDRCFREALCELSVQGVDSVNCARLGQKASDVQFCRRCEEARAQSIGREQAHSRQTQWDMDLKHLYGWLDATTCLVCREDSVDPGPACFGRAHDQRLQGTSRRCAELWAGQDRCYRCYGRGHRQPDCPTRNIPSTATICFMCGVPGCKSLGNSDASNAKRPACQLDCVFPTLGFFRQCKECVHLFDALGAPKALTPFLNWCFQRRPGGGYPGPNYCRLLAQIIEWRKDPGSPSALTVGSVLPSDLAGLATVTALDIHKRAVKLRDIARVDVRFNSADHSYEVATPDGHRMMASHTVTGLVKSVFPFDADQVIADRLPHWRHTSSHYLHDAVCGLDNAQAAIAVKALWDASAACGTAIHEALELWIKEARDPDTSDAAVRRGLTNGQAAVAELRDMYGFVVVASEMRVCSVDARAVAGTLDLLLFDDTTKEYAVADFKSTPARTNLQFRDCRERGKGLGSSLPACKHVQFALQMHLYAQMLEANVGIVPRRFFIVRVPGCRDSKHEIIPIHRIDGIEDVARQLLSRATCAVPSSASAPMELDAAVLAAGPVPGGDERLVDDEDGSVIGEDEECIGVRKDVDLEWVPRLGADGVFGDVLLIDRSLSFLPARSQLEGKLRRLFGACTVSDDPVQTKKTCGSIAIEAIRAFVVHRKSAADAGTYVSHFVSTPSAAVNETLGILPGVDRYLKTDELLRALAPLPYRTGSGPGKFAVGPPSILEHSVSDLQSTWADQGELRYAWVINDKEPPACGDHWVVVLVDLRAESTGKRPGCDSVDSTQNKRRREESDTSAGLAAQYHDWVCCRKHQSRGKHVFRGLLRNFRSSYDTKHGKCFICGHYCCSECILVFDRTTCKHTSCSFTDATAPNGVRVSETVHPPCPIT